MARKSKLPYGKLALAAAAVGAGIYGYRNRDTLRTKFAAVLGKQAIASAAPAPAIAAAKPAAAKPVVAKPAPAKK